MQSKPLVTPTLKGIDQRWKAPADSATRVQDMRWDGRGFWTSAGGYGLIQTYINNESVVNPFTGVGVITSLHYFSQHNGARNWLIYEAGNGNLYEYNPSTAARSGSPGDIAEDRAGTQQTDRARPSTPWQHSQSATWGDNFYIINGINRPLVFDGYCWDYAGFSGPAGAPSVVVMSSPQANTNSGIQLTSVGLGPASYDTDVDYKVGYRYRMSFINYRNQESPLSAPSELATFTNSGGVDADNGASFIAVNLPIGDASVVKRRLYRTQNVFDSSGNPIQGYADQFFFHSDIADNITAVVMDGLMDSNLGTPVDPLNFGPWPAAGKYLAPFKGCMFVTGATQTDVYFSAPGQPEVFPVDNVMPVGDAYLGPITGLYGTRNALVVFKEHGIYLIKGDPVNGFTASLFTKTTGCVAPNTVREVPGLGLVFLGASGVYLLRGTLENEGVQTEVVPLHIPITEILKRVNRSAVIGAFGCVYHRDKEYWLALPMIGSDQNDLVLVYHYEIAEWSYRENYPISCMLETADHRGHLLFGSWDATNTEGIYLYSPGFDDKAGTTIEPLYQTGWFNPGSTWRSSRPKYVLVQCGLHGNNGINLSVTSNRQLSEWPQQPSQAQQYPGDAQVVYGTATFDSGTDWTAFRPGSLRFDIVDPTKAEVHELSAQFTPDSGKRWMSLLAIDPELSPDDPNEWKPLGRPPGGR